MIENLGIIMAIISGGLLILLALICSIIVWPNWFTAVLGFIDRDYDYKHEIEKDEHEKFYDRAG